MLTLTLTIPKLYIPAPETPLEMLYHAISEEMWDLRKEPRPPQPLLCVVINNTEWRKRFVDSIPAWLEREPFELRVTAEPIPPPSSGLFQVIQVTGWDSAGIVAVFCNGASCSDFYFTPDGSAGGGFVTWQGGADYYALTPFPPIIPIPLHRKPRIPRSRYSPWIPLRQIKAAWRE